MQGSVAVHVLCSAEENGENVQASSFPCALLHFRFTQETTSKERVDCKRALRSEDFLHCFLHHGYQLSQPCSHKQINNSEK